MKVLARYLAILLFPVMNIFVRLYQAERDRRVQSALRHKAKKVGEGVVFHPNLEMFGAEGLSIGDNVHIGEGAYIRADGGLRIGSHTQISRRVIIYTHNHQYKGKRLPFDEELVCKPVEIGAYVWIGMGVTILAGAHIGDGAIIGAGCVIKGEVPKNAIVSRNDSQQIISYRDDAHVQALLKQEAFAGASGYPR